jgi:rubrerythrin
MEGPGLTPNEERDMDPTTQRTIDGLRQAMQAEHDGHHFYRMAATTTADPKGREIFEQLAGEEKEHYLFLDRQLEAVTKTGRLDPEARLGEPGALDVAHPIFTPEIRGRIAAAHFEMTALAIGIQLEASAVEFYSKEAGAAPLPDMKAFYEKLAAWERGHLTALQRQADELKEDYWHAARFAPF